MVQWKSAKTIEGTEAERLAIPASTIEAGWRFTELDNFEDYIWNGTTWIPLGGLITPPDISDLAMWLDPSDESSVIRDGSNFVSQWTDKSGLGNSPLQGTQNDKPVWTENQQNGLPLIIFDGVNDHMDFTSFNGGALVQPNTIFCVARIPTISSGGGGANAVMWDTPNIGERNLFNIATLTTYRMHASINLTSPDSLQTTVDQFTLFFNTTLSSMRRNQVEIIAPADAGDDEMQGLRIAGGQANNNFSNTQMGEMIIYNKLLTETERDDIELYLKTKWATL